MTTAAATLDQVTTIRAALANQLAALPDENDATSINARDAIFAKRHALRAHAEIIDRLSSRIAKLDARLNQQHNAPWLRCLTTLRDQRRTQLDALPFDAVVKRNGLLMELSVIEFGPGESEAMTSTLFDQIIAAGFPAENGLLFRHRGGLFEVEGRVNEIERELAPLRAELSGAVTAASAIAEI